MPPDRGRASKACSTCRKIKTRCYESDIAGKACLRCERLHQACSLQEISFAINDFGQVSIGQGSIQHSTRGNSSQDDRLSHLERTVAAIVDRLGDGTGRWVPYAELPSTSPVNPPPINEHISATPSTAPVFVIRDVASEVGVRQQPLSPELTHGTIVSDIITKGLLTVAGATSLIELFQEHYGRWVSFNETLPPAALLQSIRRSPLLLCACCLIAVRHMSHESTTDLAPQLFQEAKSLLSSSMLEVPQQFEFFQACVILSMWSTTIGQTPLSIDSWLLSGFALQHSLASDMFAPIASGNRLIAPDKSELQYRIVWNHLCLAHLHYCIGTRRKAILDRQQVEKSRDILAFDHVTNFQTRMVAEISLYWIIYENCSKSQVDLPSTQASLYEWKQEWKFLFDQPRSQFIQMGFHFAQLLVYDQALKSRSAAVRESLLSEMIRLSGAIIQLALDTTDSRTRHLSDHIYHMITFAAVTLCRLLHMYENQLSASHNIVELDSRVLTLVTWLHSIGLPCHVAHTLGDVVSAFHEKLRPNAHPSPYGQAQDDIALYFPELLGIETYDNGNFDFNPQWEPYIQGPAT